MRQTATSADLALAEGRSDERLFIQFDIQAEEDPDASAKEGRPVFKDVDFIKIAKPGELDIVHRKYWDDPQNPNSDSSRFGRQYEAWKRGKGDGMVGTPLSQWAGVTASQIKELEFRHVRTVEQLASMPDSSAQNFMGGNGLKQRARDWLESAKGAAHLTQMRKELETRDSQIEALQRALKEQGERLEKLAAKKG